MAVDGVRDAGRIVAGASTRASALVWPGGEGALPGGQRQRGVELGYRGLLHYNTPFAGRSRES